MKDYYFQQAAVRNINRQKMKINNSKKYTIQEKRLIMKGLQMGIDRVNTAYLDEKYRMQAGLPKLTR